MIKVMICDDMKEIRQYFEYIVNQQKDMQVIAVADSGAKAVALAEEKKPDIILMDIQMDGMRDGITALAHIMETLTETKIIMLTIHDDDDLLIESYAAGAVDYLLKETEADIICNTIRSAYSNKYFVGPIIAQKVRERFNKGSNYEKSMVFFINNMVQLTNSEWMILKHLYANRKRREIAKIEKLSEDTVKFHVHNILKKLNFTSTKEMIVFLKQTEIMEKINID